MRLAWRSMPWCACASRGRAFPASHSSPCGRPSPSSRPVALPLTPRPSSRSGRAPLRQRDEGAAGLDQPVFLLACQERERRPAGIRLHATNSPSIAFRFSARRSVLLGHSAGTALSPEAAPAGRRQGSARRRYFFANVLVDRLDGAKVFASDMHKRARTSRIVSSTKKA